MQKIEKKNSIPDLRKKNSYDEEFDLRLLDPRYFALVTGVVVLILMFSIMLVAAAPNSNFPASM
ncbi:hypothetical protein FGU46_07615 [Methanobacterium sp. CWC-01]|uniref:hypothetical protein n=1 Tax=Methanobacterium aridiramus TaxID=2584467 RepID=UPI0025770556|nr:hypothetical protein [Methanobacterium sp. CWC-01]WJI09964.1 hypothetical protein FGU46_07615 [Methanobacterium sp. CWC-01]